MCRLYVRPQAPGQQQAPAEAAPIDLDALFDNGEDLGAEGASWGGHRAGGGRAAGAGRPLG